MTLRAFKRRFEGYLKQFLNRKNVGIERYTADPSVLMTVRYTSHLIMAGGKRFRPYLAYLMFVASGGRPRRELFRILVAVELFHFFCLIHDDIIDRGRERHGLKTVHEHLETFMKTHGRMGDRRHIAEGEAMLMGDLLFAWAFEILEEARGFPLERLKRARAVFRRLVEEVIVGETLDVDTTTRKSISSDLVMEKIVLKSARYSFVRPMQFGLALKGEDNRLAQFCETFGTALGIAFQVHDDLFDLTSSEERIKKTTMSDLEAHQHTPYTQYLRTRGSAQQRRAFERYFGKPLTLAQRRRARTLLESSGAINYGRRLIERYLKKAQRLLERSEIRLTWKRQFSDLIETLRIRSS